MKNKRFTGIMPALITPFDEEAELKESALRAILRKELADGVQGFYINGATGKDFTCRSTPGCALRRSPWRNAAVTEQ